MKREFNHGVKEDAISETLQSSKRCIGYGEAVSCCPNKKYEGSRLYCLDCDNEKRNMEERIEMFLPTIKRSKEQVE